MIIEGGGGGDTDIYKDNDRCGFIVRTSPHMLMVVFVMLGVHLIACRSIPSACRAAAILLIGAPVDVAGNASTRLSDTGIKQSLALHYRLLGTHRPESPNLLRFCSLLCLQGSENFPCNQATRCTNNPIRRDALERYTNCSTGASSCMQSNKTPKNTIYLLRLDNFASFSFNAIDKLPFPIYGPDATGQAILYIHRSTQAPPSIPPIANSTKANISYLPS